MKLTLAEPKFLKDGISIISDLVNEATIKLTAQGLELIAMDPANVAMVIYNLLASGFSEYQLEKDEEFAINLANLKQILRRSKPADQVTLELAEGKLKIQLKGKTIRTFSIPIIDLDDKEQKVPELSFGATITMAASTLNDAIEDADIVAESVSFLANKEGMTVIAEGDLSHAKIEIKSDDTTQINVHGDGELRAKYSIEYLKKMMQGAKIADNVAIHFNNDYPLRLDYKTVDRVSLSFILAPRVENY